MPNAPVISDISQYLTAFKIFELQPVVSVIITLILIIAVVLFLILLIVGGIQWVTSGGDKEKIASARGRIIAALIGLAIVLLAWAIMGVLQGFFGFQLKGELPGPGNGNGNGEDYINCCFYPEHWGGEFRISSAECESAKSNLKLSQCLGDGQRFRWYQYEARHCDQFYINKTCWQEHH